MSVCSCGLIVGVLVCKMKLAQRLNLDPGPRRPHLLPAITCSCIEKFIRLGNRKVHAARPSGHGSLVTNGEFSVALIPRRSQHSCGRTASTAGRKKMRHRCTQVRRPWRELCSGHMVEARTATSGARSAIVRVFAAAAWAHAAAAWAHAAAAWAHAAARWARSVTVDSRSMRKRGACTL